MLIVCVAMLGISGAAVNGEELEMDAAEVIQAVYAAVEAQDLAGASAYLADDVVLVLSPPPPETDGTFVGKEVVLGWYENLIQNNIAIEFSNAEISGDRVTLTNNTWVDDLPIAPVEFDGTGIVQDGLVKTMSWVVTLESKAELDAAFAKAANEELARRWLYHWDTVNGKLEGLEDILSGDFVSYNMPEADHEGMVAGVAGFRADNPGAYFPAEELYVTDDKAFIINRMWMVPENAPAGDEGEPASPPFLLILGLKDGKINERWLYAPAQPYHRNVT